MENARRKGFETELLRENIAAQVDRLLTQLEDLEELKDEFTAEEHQEIHNSTLDQLREFQIFLQRSLSGDLRLENEFEIETLAIQAAVSGAFKTPEVIRMFAEKQPTRLRMTLESMQRELKLKKITEESFNSKAYEVLLALKALKAKLSPEEIQLMQKLSLMSGLETAFGELTLDSQENILSFAGSNIQSALQ